MRNSPTIEELRLLKSGRLSCVENARRYIERISERNAALNCVACIDPTAIDQARRLDEAGDRALPLFGLCVLVKDNIDVAGLPTTAGSLALADNIAREDAPVIARLRKNGAVILGKTNMTELANYTTQGMPNGFSSAGGQVVSAISPEIDPGGSSTGSGVAVSAGLCSFAIGTDTLFSVVGCAFANRVFGLKPSIGTLSQRGIVPIAHTLDSAGVLAADVQGLIAGLNGMLDTPLSGIQPLPPEKLRFAINISGRENVAEAQLNLYDALAAELRDLGASVSYVRHPASPQAKAIMRGEFRQDLESYLAGSSADIKTLDGLIGFYKSHPEAMPYGISLLEAATEPDRRGYAAAMEERDALRRQLQDEMQHADICLMTGSTGIFHLCGLPSVTMLIGADDGDRRYGAIMYGKDERSLLSAALTIDDICGNIRPAFIR